MTLEDAREERELAERRIRQALQDFTARTELNVDSVEFESVDSVSVSGDSRGIISKVKINCSL